MATWKQFEMSSPVRDAVPPVLSQGHDKPGAVSLHIVAIPDPDRAAEWTRLIAKPFENGADAVLTVAEGVEIAEGTFGALVDSLAKHPDTILGGRVFDAARPHYVVQEGYWWSDCELKWCPESYMEIIPDPTAPLFWQADYLSAAALVIPRRVWETLGGFDARFGSFLSDVDFCLRAKRQGFNRLVIRNARFQTARGFDSFRPSSESDRLRSTLLLARQHRIPRGILDVAWRYVFAMVTEELDRVDDWTDYGTDIGWPRRLLWYTRSCVQAVRRERLRVALREIFATTRIAAVHGNRKSAR